MFVIPLLGAQTWKMKHHFQQNLLSFQEVSHNIRIPNEAPFKEDLILFSKDVSQHTHSCLKK